jgi:RNA recognition motif-containing protein
VVVYVGNLNWNTTDKALRRAFSAYGSIVKGSVMKDRETGLSRGFGMVTYSTSAEAEAAIASMNEQEFQGRRIKVNWAYSRTTKSRGHHGPGYGGYGSGGLERYGTEHGDRPVQGSSSTTSDTSAEQEVTPIMRVEQKTTPIMKDRPIIVEAENASSELVPDSSAILSDNSSVSTLATELSAGNGYSP